MVPPPVPLPASLPLVRFHPPTTILLLEREDEERRRERERRSRRKVGRETEREKPWCMRYEENIALSLSLSLFYPLILCTSFSLTRSIAL
ncbi:hypothetical protein ANTPLA_LOCUS5464 [Anthophora plagiata]